MAKTNISEVAISDTFQVWLNKTNQLVDLMTSDVMTASPFGDTTIGDANLDGDFSAVNITVSDSLESDSFSTNSISLPNVTSSTFINVQARSHFTSTSANPLVLKNSTGPKLLIQNNTANWEVGLANNTTSSKFVITTSGLQTPLMRVSTNGDLEIEGDMTAEDISANKVTAEAFLGNASTATKLEDTFTISIGGDISYTSSGIDGSSNVNNNATITQNAVTNDKFRKSGSLSIVGRSANSLGNVSDIAATNDHQVLRRSGNSLGFGAINLGQNNAVTGTLSVTNGGTGNTLFTSGRILIGNGSNGIVTDSSLFFDRTNNRLGIGITPQYSVDVNGDVRADNFRGVATSAKYADLAEKFVPDSEYQYGTVVCVGGDKEITATTETDLAIGVISENPALMMNSEIDGLYVALKGRVPVKIDGSVKKGDKLVPSSKKGYAKKAFNFNEYNIFAVALEDSKDGIAESIIL